MCKVHVCKFLFFWDDYFRLPTVSKKCTVDGLVRLANYFLRWVLRERITESEGRMSLRRSLPLPSSGLAFGISCLLSHTVWSPVLVGRL
jgi:hypothetical protein